MNAIEKKAKQLALAQLNAERRAFPSAFWDGKGPMRAKLLKEVPAFYWQNHRAAWIKKAAQQFPELKAFNLESWQKSGKKRTQKHLLIKT